MFPHFFSYDSPACKDAASSFCGNMESTVAYECTKNRTILMRKNGTLKA